ncbi:helix-turn-helix domain-containing protein [Flavobacterium sp. xlx-214]|uniref:helix-turn-helix domain-containing protein n=1 Tax=unclassified Flavobacterium TaxID=196869 RepID=UPI0013D03120|nr:MULTISPECIES: helix-turn-helix domain-containing protein [unclassified Flavobacterium]MBA5791706.1 helix-turn-helix domain-containing protein [Flavobacterium sp. xlx-221]QMI82947.1 helix-turn-helix domain-containing protein [Flavobacterium sp. xlx-214]
MSKLKQIREQQNLTQEELSEKSGISVRTIQRIESGIEPKGHTLKALSKSLDILENELTKKLVEDSIEESLEKPIEFIEPESGVDYQKIKLINLSSILFILIPPLNILAPLILSYVLKQKNNLSKQIISLQILWTILAPIFFMLGIFLKLGHSFTIVILIIIVLSNVFLILRNLAEIDKSKKLRYKLNFNMI